MHTNPKGSKPGLIHPTSDNDVAASLPSPVESVVSGSSLSEGSAGGSTLDIYEKNNLSEKKAIQPIAVPVAAHSNAEKAERDEEASIGDREVPTWFPPTLSRTATLESREAPYPEGGREAWLVVFGSLLGMFCAFGFMNSIGVFNAYLHEHQLSAYPESEIGWIFSLYIFLSFGLGLQIGPIFDKHGPKLLMTAGAVLLTLAVVCMSFSTAYWHFMLSIGVVAGTGSSLLFTPSISAIGHFFLKRRGAATGIGATGGSLGGILFPLMLQHLFKSIGWAWALRCLALIIGVCGAVSVVLVKSRLQPRAGSSVWPDMRILRQPAFAFTTAGVFFMEWGLFIPITYLSTYIVSTGVVEPDSSLPFTILSVLNAGSCLGRFLPGFYADKVGRFNSTIVMLILCMVTTIALWLPASVLPKEAEHFLTIKVLTFVYAAVFGFASGSNISLTPVCVGQLCRTEEYGRYYATCYTIVAVGTLTGIPIAGALLQACNGGYLGVVLFTGACYVLSSLCMAAARYKQVGWNWVKY